MVRANRSAAQDVTVPSSERSSPAEAADERVRTVDVHARAATPFFGESDKGHGRIDKRSIELCRTSDG